MRLPQPRNSTAYAVAGPRTFRLASKQILATWGSNLQNVAKDMRCIYVAPPGRKFVQKDQAGAEALVVAYIAPAGKLRKLFEVGIKSHVYVALHLFADVWERTYPNLVNIAKAAPVEMIKDLPGWKQLEKLIKESDKWPPARRYYFMAKKVCHASNYGMFGGTFQIAMLEESDGTIVLTRQEADRFLATYHSIFPEIRQWQIGVQEEVKRTKTLRNLFGFPYLFTGYVGDSMWKEAYAFVPQSTVGTITNIAYTNLQNYIEESGKDWHLLANTHDSYMVECPEGETDECNRIMGEFLNQWLTTADGTRFQMKSEGQVGQNWGPYDAEKNPEGLKEI